MGFKYNLTDIAAAIGLLRLDRAEELLEARRAIARAYSSGFRATRAADLWSFRLTRKMGHMRGIYTSIRLNLDRLTIDRAEVMDPSKDLGAGRASTSSRCTCIPITRRSALSMLTSRSRHENSRV